MTVHKEGYKILSILIISFTFLNVLSFNLFDNQIIEISILLVSIVLFGLVLQFFRSPKRTTIKNEDHVICPADGEVVVIEETEESEYFQEKRIQVSIFMSPTNVHINRYPVSGEVTYTKYHPGKFLLAWNPKSSTENERTTVVVKNNKNIEVLFRQIAGFVARRIVMYSKPGDKALQGEDFGFIKFGSRVDVFLPLDAKLNIKLNDKVRGGETILAMI